MTTYIKPLDKRLQDYAESLRQMVLDAFSGEAGSDNFGDLGVYINRTAIHFEGRAFKRLGEKVQTPELERFVRDLRDFTNDVAWPVSFDLAFVGWDAQPRLVSLRLSSAPLGEEFLKKGEARAPSGREMHGHEIRGLHKLLEAADLIGDLGFPGDAPIMEWNFVDHGLETNFCWIGIHARSAEEAMLKLFLSQHGYEATRAACETGDFASLLGSEDIDLVAQPLYGLENNPCGITDDTKSTLAKLASLATTSRQRRALGSAA